MAESISSRVAWKLRKVISGGSRDAPSRTGTATVQRRDADGTVWVRFPGSSIDTPVTGAVVADVAAGDTISYDLSGGRVSVTGNASDPAAGTNTVRAVRKAAESARKVAGKAQDIADAIGQHFWADDNGAHVSTEKDDPTGERNILMNSLGILLRQGSSWLASFSDSAVAFYDGLGNAAANVVAQFGADGAVIGRASGAHVLVKPTYLMETTPSGDDMFEVGRILDDDGYADYVDVEQVDTATSVFALTHRGQTIKGYTYDDQTAAVTIDPIAVSVNGTETNAYTLSAVAQAGGDVVHVTLDTEALTGDVVQIAYRTTASAVLSMQFGIDVQATGDCSSAFGVGSVASGTGAHAEGGYHTVRGDFTYYYGGGTAKGDACHAEGEETIASGLAAHAEGYRTVASGTYSHAEGERAVASGSRSHAEGFGTTANGFIAHAQNYGTKADYDYQTAIGKYNANNSANAFEIGNGTSSNRSNAFTVAWDGTVTAAGEVKGASVEASVTLASGVSATTRTVKRSGNVVTLYIDGLNLAAELANHGSATVATVPSGYRPAYAAYAQLSGWNNGGSYATVGTNGSVTVSNQSGAAIPTARSLGLTLTYVM